MNAIRAINALACVLAWVTLAIAIAGCREQASPQQHAVIIRPADPPECLSGPIDEPRLADADITDDVAARDRDALKRAFRASEAHRRICRAALERRNRRD